MKKKSDQELMAGFQGGNTGDFEKLVARYSTALYGFVYRILKDEGESQDLVQETFLRVYQKSSQYNPKYPVKAWIYSIASHLAINVLKSARKKYIFFFWEPPNDKSDGQEKEIVDAKKNPEEVLSTKQSRERLNQAINKLNPRQKIALTLNKIEGLSYKEVSEIMNINVHAVESLIFRAKQKIQGELNKKIKK